MSSIRLFILSSFAELGPTHGHRVRPEAERTRVPLPLRISNIVAVCQKNVIEAVAFGHPVAPSDGDRALHHY